MLRVAHACVACPCPVFVTWWALALCYVRAATHMRAIIIWWRVPVRCVCIIMFHVMYLLFMPVFVHAASVHNIYIYIYACICICICIWCAPVYDHISLSLYIYIYQYIYIYIYVCVA